MIEGVGCNEGPFFSYNKTAGCGCDYLTFIVEPSRMIKTDSEDLYCIHEISFPIANTKYAAVRGCDLPIGEKVSNYGGPNELTFVLEDGLLHVYGNVCVGCASTDYVYFVELPTENPNCHKLKMSIDVTALEVATCQGMYQTDFWVPGFGFGDMENGTAAFNTDTIEYKVVITEPYRTYEYPVIKKRQQTLTSRPFVEENKVWKVGAIPADTSNNRIDMVQYFYFDGDTIIDGKVCKRMMLKVYANEGSNEYSTYNLENESLRYIGAWYEEDKKVYFYDEDKQSMRMMYDFSLSDNESLYLFDDYPPFTIGPRKTGGIEYFKGIYRDIMLNNVLINQNIKNTTWLEGVGGIEGPTKNAFPKISHFMTELLMSCFIGDEVIYFNDEYEDGATPDGMNAKKRFDFTHTIKTQPKAPMRRVAEQSLYGEYNNLQLGINLNSIDDAYLVRITDKTGKVVYEKDIFAGYIVGLDIDISNYGEGRYTITMENSHESFTGEFEVQTTGIEEVRNNHEMIKGYIYNLQGQRISTLQKGLNIVNGRKIYVK
jgi:hypothetical protein